MNNHVWKDKIFIAIITIPNNINRIQKLFSNLKNYGIPLPYIYYGQAAAISANNLNNARKINDIIYQNHKDLTSWFIKKKLYNKWHLLILEDDAEFIGNNVTKKLFTAIDYLDNNCKTWKSLHIGSVPLGPIMPIGNNLCYTTLPFTAHAYILNKNTITELKPKKWSRPYFLEGNLSINIKDKFAIYPSICIQNIKPKEMDLLPGLKNMSYSTGEKIMVKIALLVTAILCILSLYLGYPIIIYLMSLFV